MFVEQSMKAMQSRKIPAVCFFLLFWKYFAFSGKHRKHSRKPTDAYGIGISSASPSEVQIKSEPGGDFDILIIQQAAPISSASFKLQEIRNAFLDGNTNANKCGNNLAHSAASPFGAFDSLP